MRFDFGKISLKFLVYYCFTPSAIIFDGINIEEKCVYILYVNRRNIYFVWDFFFEKANLWNKNLMIFGWVKAKQPNHFISNSQSVSTARIFWLCYKFTDRWVDYHVMIANHTYYYIAFTLQYILREEGKVNMNSHSHIMWSFLLICRSYKWKKIYGNGDTVIWPAHIEQIRIQFSKSHCDSSPDRLRLIS